MRDTNCLTRLCLVAIAICFSLGHVSAVTAVERAGRQPTNIARQDLARALQILANDRNFQLVYRSDLVSDWQTRGATGVLTFDEALIQLLAGTDLIYRYLDDNAITIVRQP